MMSRRTCLVSADDVTFERTMYYHIGPSDGYPGTSKVMTNWLDIITIHGEM